MDYEEADKAILAKLQHGLDQSAAGQVEDLGDFTAYLDDDEEAEAERSQGIHLPGGVPRLAEGHPRANERAL